MKKGGAAIQLALCGMLMLLAGARSAGAAETWSAIYPGGEHDRIAAIQETTDGGCLVAGYTNDWGSNNCFWLLRLDEQGAVAWKRAYGNGGNFTDSGLVMLQTPDTGCIIACTLSYGPGNEDILVLKLRQNGDLQWQKQLGGSGNDRAFFIRQTRDGGCILGGWTNGAYNGVNYDCLLIKLDASGTTQWQNTYGGAYSDQATSILQTDDGGYLMAGWTYSFSRDGRDIWLLKLAPDGTLQWQKLYDGSKDDANYSLRQGTSGVYIVECCNLLEDHYDVLTLLLRPDGALDRRKTYSGKYRTGCGRIHAACQTKDEGYVMTGGVKPTCEGSRDAVLMKRLPNGETGWMRSFGGAADDYADAVAQTLDSGYLLAGWTYSFGTEDRAIWVLRLDSQGRIADDAILHPRNTAAQGFEIAAVPAVHLGSGQKKLTFVLGPQDDLNLYVSGPLGHRYVFQVKDIPALREALAQALALLGARKNTSALQDLATITNGPHTLTIAVRGNREGKEGIGLLLRETPGLALSADNPLIIAPEEAQKIIASLAPDNLNRAHTAAQEKK